MDINTLIQKTITIGPLRLPLVLVAVLVAWIVTRLVMKKIFSEDKRLSGGAESIMINAVVIVLLVWKLTPLVLQFSTVVENPAALLYLPGGVEGGIAGLSAALIYVLIAIIRKGEERFQFLKAFAVNAGVFLAVLVLTTAAGSAFSDETSNQGRDAIEISGQPAPELEMDSIDGSEYRLADYRGKTVVLNFWASWCPPCKAELPELKSFYAESDSDEIVFLSVNLYTTENNPQGLPEFIENEGLPYPVLLDKNGGASEDYGVKSIPTTIIIDPSGYVRAVKSGAVTAAWLRRAVSE